MTETSKYPNTSTTKTSCKLVFLMNYVEIAKIESCQVAKLPNCQFAKLPSCQIVKLPSC